MTKRTDPSVKPRLILGSSSKWRQKVLSDAGYSFKTASPDIDEASIFEALREEGWPATFIANTIAEDKAEALLPKYPGKDVFLVVGDQLAEFQGVPRCKPKDAEEARAFLRGYRGAQVSLVSALAVVHARTRIMVSGTDTAVLAFADLPDWAIRLAVATGDVLQSCGAVVYEDPAIAPYVKIVQGTPDSVAGMPLNLLKELLDLHLRRLNE